MRAWIKAALQDSAELTSKGELVEAVRLGESAIARATDEEHDEIRQWLADHADAFERRTGR